MLTSTNNFQQFGTWLKLTRQAIGLTRSQLADEARMSGVVLVRIERRGLVPTVDERRRLVAAVAAHCPARAAAAPGLNGQAVVVVVFIKSETAAL